MLKPRTRLTKKKLKEDKLVTAYFKAIDYYQLYQKYILGGVGALVILILLIVFVSQTREANELKASGDLAGARAELARMNFPSAIDSLQKTIIRYEGTRSAGDATFYLANTYFFQKQFDLAQKYYEEYLDSYGGDSNITYSAMVGVAACVEENKEFKAAAEMYEKAATKYDEVFNAAEGLMNAGRCYIAAGLKENAKKAYQLVLEKYPNSGYKNNAELNLAELDI